MPLIHRGDDDEGLIVTDEPGGLIGEICPNWARLLRALPLQ